MNFAAPPINIESLDGRPAIEIHHGPQQSPNRSRDDERHRRESQRRPPITLERLALDLCSYGEDEKSGGDVQAVAHDPAVDGDREQLQNDPGDDGRTLRGSSPERPGPQTASLR